MRIGIVTTYKGISRGENYGSLFQVFALQTVLRKMGHNPFMIRHRQLNMREYFHSNKTVFFRLLLSRTYHNLRDLFAARGGRDFKKERKFGDFIKKHISATAETYSDISIRANPPDAEAYIVGSDQIWHDVSNLSFLNFGPAKTKRIAYAVSAPWETRPKEWFAKGKAYVKKLNAVSVREKEGVNACAKLGVEAQWVLDPTLLLDKNEYLKLSEGGEQYQTENNYILYYLLNIKNAEEAHFSQLSALADSQGLEKRVVGVQGAETSDLSEQSGFTVPTPYQWLHLYSQAKTVVTNSFHGTLFAIIMEKPFLVHLQSGVYTPENCRYLSVLSRLGLEERLLTPSDFADPEKLKSKMDAGIDWKNVNALLQPLKENSLEFLKKHL